MSSDLDDRLGHHVAEPFATFVGIFYRRSSGYSQVGRRPVGVENMLREFPAGLISDRVLENFDGSLFNVPADVPESLSKCRSSLKPGTPLFARPANTLWRLPGTQESDIRNRKNGYDPESRH